MVYPLLTPKVARQLNGAPPTADPILPPTPSGANKLFRAQDLDAMPGSVLAISRSLGARLRRKYQIRGQGSPDHSRSELWNLQTRR